jgi:PAS domain S-box-containing protein
MIFIHSAGRVVYANARCEQIMGYTREEFYSPGFDFISLSAPDTAGLLRQSYTRHLRGEEVLPFEYALITKDGKRLEAILSTRLIRYGGESAILGTITDITNRKRTERLLQALNTAGLAMERTLSLEEILPAAGTELRKLGFQSAVFLCDETGGNLRLSYLSHDPAVIEELESLVGLKLKDFVFPPENAASYLH